VSLLRETNWEGENKIKRKGDEKIMNSREGKNVYNRITLGDRMLSRNTEIKLKNNADIIGPLAIFFCFALIFKCDENSRILLCSVYPLSTYYTISGMVNGTPFLYMYITLLICSNLRH
jgi:hypothetical protein